MIFGSPILTSPPAAMPLTLAELKAHARLEGINDGAEDAYLAGLLRIATNWAEEYTGLALITQTWTQTFSEFPSTAVPDTMVLRRRPVQAISSVVYLDGDGAPQLLDPVNYQVSGIGSDKASAVIRLATNGAWPAIYGSAEAVTVTYISGFGDDANAVPEMIRHAISVAAATLYRFREDIELGAGAAAGELPFASKALLHDWRPLAVA